MLDIAEVARRAGLTTSTLRYYERESLIEPVARHARRRQYDVAVMKRLALIEIGRNAGFTLAEIRTILDSNLDRTILNDLCRTKIAEIDDRIALAQLSKTYLEHTLNCPVPQPLACPTLADLLDGILPRR